MSEGACVRFEIMYTYVGIWEYTCISISNGDSVVSPEKKIWKDASFQRCVALF